MKKPQYDLICIGFGPAGISLGVAIKELIVESKLDSNFEFLFLESKACFGWHENFLLPGTIINHHPNNDVVTPRNPSSSFSFINFLKSKNRIYKHGFLGGKVYRSEWNEYLKWCAARLNGRTRFNCEIQKIHRNIKSNRYK